MKQRYVARPGRAVTVSTRKAKGRVASNCLRPQRTTRRVTASFYYDVSSDDPADWELDPAELGDLIYGAILDLDHDVLDEEPGPGTTVYYTLETGDVIDSYEIETNLLGKLSEGAMDDHDIYQFILSEVESQLGDSED